MFAMRLIRTAASGTKNQTTGRRKKLGRDNPMRPKKRRRPDKNSELAEKGVIVRMVYDAVPRRTPAFKSAIASPI